MKQRISQLEAIEAKMARLERLEEQEQRLYDSIGLEELRSKVRQVGKKLTAAEKNDFMERVVREKLWKSFGEDEKFLFASRSSSKGRWCR